VVDNSQTATREGLNIALAQINAFVGDIDRNVDLIRDVRRRAAAAGADLVICPELVIVGYPPEDLVLRPAFVDAARRAVHQLECDTRDAGPALLVSSPWRDEGALYNAAILLHQGTRTVRYKHELPNYGVFDEKRVFGPMPEPVPFRGVNLGIAICEDMWYPAVSAHLAGCGAELLIVPNGSPFESAKQLQRVELARARVSETGRALAYVNLVGGQDELVFDGGSFVVNPDGTVAHELPQWVEACRVTTWSRRDGAMWCDQGSRVEENDLTANIYQAMMLGLRDYVEKNGFPGVLLGLSGGIDSALSAAVAVDALGSDRVRGVRLPSQYTSTLSLDDAHTIAQRLGIALDTVSIAPVVETMERQLQPAFHGLPPDVTEENLQARARGVLLMALSNKFGLMLLTTGNKSEMSVGYATLYGDMCGGYSVLKDVYKTEVYALAAWRNRHQPIGGRGPAGLVVPPSTIARAPTAELRPNQTDQDTLPPYAELDAILHALIEEEASVDEIVAAGHDRALVKRVQRMLFTAEYKRRQAPPGVKISHRSFGRDRRYPITNRFHDRD
jgi:NAD+ synthase